MNDASRSYNIEILLISAFILTFVYMDSAQAKNSCRCLWQNANATGEGDCSIAESPRVCRIEYNEFRPELWEAAESQVVSLADLSKVYQDEPILSPVAFSKADWQRFYSESKMVHGPYIREALVARLAISATLASYSDPEFPIAAEQFFPIIDTLFAEEPGLSDRIIEAFLGVEPPVSLKGVEVHEGCINISWNSYEPISLTYKASWSPFESACPRGEP